MKDRAPKATRVLPARGTADGDALARAYDAFDRGDFASARAAAKALVGAADADVRDGAKTLVTQLGVDPLTIAVWAVCFGFFVFTAVRYLS